MSKLILRSEKPIDLAGVRAVNLAAFEGPIEAELVETIRRARSDFVSLVAIDGSRVVGHIFFTPITHETIRGGMALGPMSVHPDYQRKGIGSALIELGLAALIGRKCPFVVVLGHPTYYPRFGFLPANLLGISCPWPNISEGVFMVLVLDDKIADKLAGGVKYLPEFDATV